jgi:hypothetical protein
MARAPADDDYLCYKVLQMLDRSNMPVIVRVVGGHWRRPPEGGRWSVLVGG